MKALNLSILFSAIFFAFGSIAMEEGEEEEVKLSDSSDEEIVTGEKVCQDCKNPHCAKSKFLNLINQKEHSLKDLTDIKGSSRIRWSAPDSIALSIVFWFPTKVENSGR